jgi:shikimate kinase
VRGVGASRAAISVVNALPLGVGAALAIDWPARVAATLRRTSPRSVRLTVRPKGSSTSIVREAATAAQLRFGAAGRLTLTVRSTIPVRRGLKSSSAVGCAVVQATARAAGADPSPEEVARLVAEVGRSSGQSATGAFDDALAGAEGRGVVTDNGADRCLRRFDPGSGLSAVLWIPSRRHPPSPAVVARFRRSPDLARRAADAAMDGDWAAAMLTNSRLVESVMGYRYAPLREAVLRAGAVAAGVSGLGPAFAAVAPSSRESVVLGALPARGGVRRSVPLYRPPRPRRQRG